MPKTTSTKSSSKTVDKKASKKTLISKTPVKIHSIKNKIFVENKHQFVENNDQIDDKGFVRKSSRPQNDTSFQFVETDEQAKSSRDEKPTYLDSVEKDGKTKKGKFGYMGKIARGEKRNSKGYLNKDSRDESMGYDGESGKNSRMPIKISSFEKMKMKKTDLNLFMNNDNAAVVPIPLEKKKRTKKMSIKIHRYDLSNKRLHDGDVLDDITNKQRKKKDEEAKDKSEVPELSMNAQFRAIKPSPSIVTFVQENFLGRRREIELRRAGYNMELPAPLDNLPFSTSSERAGVGENVFGSKMEFFAAAKVATSFPPPNHPEIAFAGRSNVGKSSLLNALTRQWGVVRTSDKPGHTQSINFFNLGKKITMVDLPGYGFAYAKDEVKEAWEDLVKEYVSTRVGLERVCLLIDTKWGMKPRDMELIHLMERSQTKYQVVLTKTDVVFPIDVARRAMQIEETLKEHKSIVQPVMMVSSKSGAGVRCLRTVLGKVGRFLKP